MKDLKILLIDNGTKSINNLYSLLEMYGSVEKANYNDIPFLRIEKFDLLVLSGSSKFNVLKNYNKFENEIKLIQQYNVPVIGICFGFELICLSFGSQIQKDEQKHDDFRIIELSTFFKVEDGKKIVKESHQWSIKAVPENLEILGKSSDGVEIIKVRGKNIFGFQFHPEIYQELTDGDDLLAQVLKYIFD